MGVIAADPMVPRFAAVASAHRETHDVVTLTLDASPWEGGFSFAPGQFNMVYAFGVGEVAISLSGDPERRDRIVHTIRAVGSVSKKLDELRKTDLVGVRGPFGQGWPLDEARGKHLVIVAGGLGLAPLRPAIYAALARRDEFERVSVLVGARAPEELVFAEELERWGKRGVEVRVTVDRAWVDWTGHVGVVTTLVDEMELDPSRAVAFACGPEVMMRFAARSLEHRGVEAARIWVSLEKNMKCAVGFCGHCQLGPAFVCKDGPVFRYDRIAPLLATREL